MQRLIGAKGLFPFAGVCLLSGALVSANAQTQTQVPQRPSAKELHDEAGDIATDPGPIDTTLSPKLTRVDVRKAMKKVADWSLVNEQPHFTQDWTYAPLYTGLLRLRRRHWVTKRYHDAVLAAAEKFNWQRLLPGRWTTTRMMRRSGQAYEELLYEENKDPIRMCGGCAY